MRRGIFTKLYDMLIWNGILRKKKQFFNWIQEKPTDATDLIWFQEAIKTALTKVKLYKCVLWKDVY